MTEKEREESTINQIVIDESKRVLSIQNDLFKSFRGELTDLIKINLLITSIIITIVSFLDIYSSDSQIYLILYHIPFIVSIICAFSGRLGIEHHPSSSPELLREIADQENHQKSQDRLINMYTQAMEDNLEKLNEIEKYTIRSYLLLAVGIGAVIGYLLQFG